MDKPLFSPLPQRTMKLFEHEWEKPQLSSVKMTPSDVGEEKSSFELSLFHCICLLQVFDMLCMFIGVVCWLESFVVSTAGLCESLSCTLAHDSQQQCCFLKRGYPESSTLCQRVHCRTVPSFTGELAPLKRVGKHFNVHIFLHFSPQSLEAKMLEMSLFWWRGMRLSQFSETRQVGRDLTCLLLLLWEVFFKSLEGRLPLIPAPD